MHTIVSMEHNCSHVEEHVETTESKVEDLPQNLWIVDLLSLHGRGVSMSFKEIFRRNRNKGNKDARNIGWL